ncbi:MAG: hypothetical protein U0572_07680 [Phycisphaerales bacterium]
MTLLSSIAAAILPRRPIGAQASSRIRTLQTAIRTLRAKYDAASNSPENRRHWLNADSLSANAAQSPAVRRTLRDRSRYEVANNCYARGIVDTLGNETVGVGPRAQVKIEGAGEDTTAGAAAPWGREFEVRQAGRSGVADRGRAVLQGVARRTPTVGAALAHDRQQVHGGDAPRGP